MSSLSLLSLYFFQSWLLELCNSSFFKWANPGLFFIYFWSFQTNKTIFTTIQCEKFHIHSVNGAGIRTHDLLTWVVSHNHPSFDTFYWSHWSPVTWNTWLHPYPQDCPFGVKIFLILKRKCLLLLHLCQIYLHSVRLESNKNTFAFLQHFKRRLFLFCLFCFAANIQSVRSGSCSNHGTKNRKTYSENKEKLYVCAKQPNVAKQLICLI